MIIVTWNLGRRNRPEQMELLAGLGADVIALQEVSAGRTTGIAGELAAIGLSHMSWDERNERIYPFVQVVAARWPIRTLDAPDLAVPAPERVQRVTIDAPAGAIELVNVHVPAATSSGVATKVATFLGLGEYLRLPTTVPRVVCGDFNTPKHEVDGVAAYWGNARQQQAERQVMEGLASVGLSDAYRSFHGPGGQAVSWRASNGVGRRYDHVFVSSDLRPTEVSYASLDAVTEAGLSDHAPLRVTLERVARGDRAARGIEAPWVEITAPARTPLPAMPTKATEGSATVDLEAFLATLSYRQDVRRAPDDPRRRQFRTGWARANGGEPYAASTLRRLTWNNLGYRAGLHFGPATGATIAATFDALAREYENRYGGMTRAADGDG